MKRTAHFRSSELGLYPEHLILNAYTKFALDGERCSKNDLVFDPTHQAGLNKEVFNLSYTHLVLILFVFNNKVRFPLNLTFPLFRVYKMRSSSLSLKAVNSEPSLLIQI